jgi:serine/threonine-protein kinase
VLGIVHRDLKPANLFLARRRGGAICLKVLDFGISRMSGSLAAGATGATATGSTFGTPLYMAPEQWVSAKHADARSDIWSLGAILYHALAGRPPFQGESIPSLWHAIGNDPPSPLRSLRADVPPALEAAVARCLQKKPDDRFRTVGELASALGPVAPARARARVDRVLALSHDEGGGEAIAAAPAAPVIGTPAQRTVTAYGLGTLPPTLRSKGTKVLVLGGVVVLIAVIGGGWLLGARDAPSRAALAPSAVAPGLVATSASAPSSAVPDPAPSGVASAPPPSAANELAGAPAPPPSSRAEMVSGEPPTAVGTAPNPAGRPLPSTPMPKRGAVPPARSTSQHGSSPTAPPPAPRSSRPNADKFE